MTDRALCVFATDQLSGPATFERDDSLVNVVSEIPGTGVRHIVTANCDDEPADFADLLIVRGSTALRLADTIVGWIETVIQANRAAKQLPTPRTHQKIPVIA